MNRREKIKFTGQTKHITRGDGSFFPTLFTQANSVAFSLQQSATVIFYEKPGTFPRTPIPLIE